MSLDAGQGRQSRPRGPGVIYASIGVSMMVLLAAVALTTRQPPPPSIAEFAPQAIEQITDAPTEQSSDFGSGQGGSGGESPGAAVTPVPGARPTPVPVDLPRVRRCVGDPPRQTEDPQSPPCVPYWSGDNGGATARGVTRDEIRVEIPMEGDRKDSYYEKLRVFFNKRFEFYGRKVVFSYNESGNGSSPPANQQAAAEKADKEHGVFASHFYRNSGGLYYARDVARRGVIVTTGPLGLSESGYLNSFRPYMWQYEMAVDQMFANIGEWGCKRLAGRPTAFGGADVNGRTRVFGIILQTYYDSDTTDTVAMEREFSGCGQTIPKERKVRNGVRQDQGGESTQPAAVDPVTSNNVIIQMKNQNVTTIFCPCNLFTAGALMKAASNQAYFPEWAFSTYGPMDINSAIVLGAAPTEQAAHAFGVTFQPRQIRPSDEPYWQAIKEVDPSASLNTDTASVQNRSESYRSLLLLMSGLQLAGPNLTAESFEKGLQRATFPNPEYPTRPGKVGFAGGSRSMTIDGAEWWWSNTAPGPYAGDKGTLCYVNGGQRYRRGSWPSGEGPFFQGPCDSGA